MRHHWPLLVLASTTAACSSGPPIYVPPAPTQAPAAPPPAPVAVAPLVLSTATATVRDLAGARIGSVTFSDSYAGLIIAGTVSGIGLGAHAVHLHAVGKCESPFTTAGPHFNPDRKNHGFKKRDGPHAGDLPNIDMPAAGTLHFEFLLKGVTVRGTTNSLLAGAGTSIVIHSGRDDYATDFEGDSGGRLACGVIRGH